MNLDKAIEKFKEVWLRDVDGVKPEKDEKIIIASPSRIIGLVNMDKIDHDVDYQVYRIKKKLTKVDNPIPVFFGKQSYDLQHISRIINDFFGNDSFPEIDNNKGTESHALLFKINDGVALGLSEVVDEYIENRGDELVLYKFTDDKGEEYTPYNWIRPLPEDAVKTIESRHEWKNNEIHLDSLSYGVLYKSEKFFEKDNTGDFLAI